LDSHTRLPDRDAGAVQPADARTSKVACLMCGVEGHPANMCQIAESIDGDCCEYYCQDCRWGL